MKFVCYIVGHRLAQIGDDVFVCRRCKGNYILDEIVQEYVENGNLTIEVVKVLERIEK
jgi:hypothetical protein